MRFVVFLDVDGVLNTKTSCVVAPSGEYKGIDGSRLKILGRAIEYAGADGVVLTTTWKDLPKNHEDYKYLKNGLEKYGVKIVGETKEKWGSQREKGIIDYLEQHKEIEEFLILDDQQYGFRDHRKLWQNFLYTEGNGIENAVYASKTPTVTAMFFKEGIDNKDCLKK